MSRYKLSFIDLDQSGKTENMPGQMYTDAAEPEATIPEIEPKKTGRVFIGWAAEPGSSEVKYEPGDKITVKQDTQLYAVWDYDKYTIRFEPNKPGNASHDVDGEMNDETVGYSEYSKGGNKDIENRYSLTGWTFTGWSTVPYAVEAEYKDSIPYEAIRKSTTDTVTLYAQWEPKRYTVTFKDEDNDTEIGKPQNIYYDTPTSLRAFESFGVTKDNEVFTHWSTLGFGSNYADRANVTNLCTVDGDGNLEGYTLYANWFETDGATIVITNNGEMVNTSEPEKDIVLIDSKGDEFTGAVSGTNGVYAVNGEDSGALPKGTYTVEFRGSLADYDTDGRAIEVDEYAGVYNFDYYTVEISADGEGKAWIAGEDQSQLEKAEKLLRGTEIKINAAAEKGYHFEQYTILGAVDDTEWDSDAAEQTITVTGEMNIDAHFAANTYRVVFNANDGETEWTVTQDMVYDQQQKLFANQFLRTGYKFIGWTKTAEWPGPTLRDYTDSEEVVNLTSENGGRFDLYAQWSPAATFIEFDKNVDEGENVEGEMSLLKTFYDMETKLSSCEFTRNYWDFTGWNTESDGSGISYPDGSNFVSDNAVDNSTLTLYAQWKPTEYTIAYDLAGGIVLGENPEAYNITTEDFTVKNPDGFQRKRA